MCFSKEYPQIQTEYSALGSFGGHRAFSSNDGDSSVACVRYRAVFASCVDFALYLVEKRGQVMSSLKSQIWLSCCAALMLVGGSGPAPAQAPQAVVIQGATLIDCNG